jgi:tRNA G18 (ribose-2'-O)-methylase SpoU
MPTTDRKLTMDELGRVAAADYSALPKQPVRVVLDDVRSRHNVGAMFRTADAFGIEGLILCGFTPCPPHREIEKTALGATLSVPWEHAPDAVDAVRRLQEQGYRVLVVEQTMEARSLQEVQVAPGERVALVLGNELNGVSDAVIAACDGCVVIPQAGSKHSLNVSVCAGVVLWWLVGRNTL